MREELVEAYDLSRDRAYLERLQLAVVESSKFALESNHGLPGSKQWWEAVRDGSIPALKVEGVVIDLRVAENWPEFEIDEQGILTTWCLEGDIKSYRIGQRARVDYVLQRLQAPLAEDGDDSAKIVLKILLEP
jgi:hypothetical protein